MGKYFDYSPPPSAFDITKGLDSFGDALTDVLNRRQKQRETDARLAMDKTQQAINLRKANEDSMRFRHQQAMDNVNAVDKIQGRLNEGDQSGAGAVAKAFGMDMQPGQPADVGPAPQAPAAPQPAMGVPPEIAARRRGLTSTSESPYVSKGRYAGSYEGVDPLAPPVITDDGKPLSVTQHEYNPETQAARYQDTQDMVREEAARADAKRFEGENATFGEASAAFPGQQRNYLAAKTRAEEERPYTLHMAPGDEGVTVHGRSQQAQREEKAQRFLDAIGGLQLSDSEKAAAANAHAAIMAGADPKTALASFQKERLLGQTEGGRNARATQHETEADKRAAMMGQWRGPMAALDVVRADEARASGNRQDQGELRRDFSDWESKVAGLPLDGKAYKRLEFVLQNISSGNALQQREAAEGLVGFFRGGVTTGAAQKYLLSHLSGLGGQAETALEHVQTGQYGAQDLAVLQQAAKNALSEQRDLVQRHHESAKVRFGPGSGFESLAPQVNAKVQGTLREFGVDVPPIYPEAGQATPLGSTARPYQAPKKPKRPAGTPPEVHAKDKAKATSALDEAMQ